jgi:hypothetical protein
MDGKNEWPGMTMKPKDAKFFDWHGYRKLLFDVFNPQEATITMVVRIDDAQSANYRGRYERSGCIHLPSKRSTRVEVTLPCLYANDGRRMDPAKLTRFNLHTDKMPQGTTLFVDAFRFEPFPVGDEQPAAAPRPLADPANPATGAWEGSEAELATAGKDSWKITFAKNGRRPSVALRAKDGSSMDWRGYGSLCFDASNASTRKLELFVRLDDFNSRDVLSRFNAGGIALAPGQTVNARINLGRLRSNCGLDMDKGRIARLVLFPDAAAEARALVIGNPRLEPAAGGSGNQIGQLGKVPGEGPVSAALDLLEDPEIKPLIPVFRQFPPLRLAICSHSASWSIQRFTVGGFIDIAAEAVRCVNTNLTYKGFHSGAMPADRALNDFLKPMQEYKPTDTYILVFPDPVSALAALADGMKSVDSRVYIFDPVFPWMSLPPQAQATIRKTCQEHGAVFLEWTKLSWGVPGVQDWMAMDEHMLTAGHLFFAKELLKEWARIYGTEKKP